MLPTTKTASAIAVTTSLFWGAAQAAQVPYATFTGAGAVSNFTLLAPDGSGSGANGNGYAWGGANDVNFTWDGSIFTSNADYAGPGSAGNAAIASSTWLLGIPWTAHTVQIFGPGSYSFDTALGGNTPEAGTLTMTVGAGQLGMHMLLNWNGNNNLDIVNVWNLNSTFSNCESSDGDTAAENCLWTASYSNPAGNNAGTVFLFASTDDDGDGTLGVPAMAGGPFGPSAGDPGHNFSFNLQGAMTPVPLPATAWLFGSGLLGLVGMARRKKENVTKS